MTTARNRAAGGEARRSAPTGPTPLGRKVLSERTAQLAARNAAAAPSAPSLQMMICAVDDGLYGLPIEDVERVQLYRRAGVAPASDAGVIGLAVDNGRIRPVVDLARRLGRKSAASSEGGYLLTLAGHDLALRAETLPEAAEVEVVNAPDGPRGRVLDGVHAAKIIVRIAAADLVGEGGA